MPTPKRPGRRNTKKESVTELIKANSYLHKYCDFLSTEVHRTAFELQKVISHMGFVESRLLDTQKMVNMMLSHLSPSGVEKVKKEMTEIQNAEVSKAQKGFHDNITKKCPICHSIGTIRDEACKECGYNKK